MINWSVLVKEFDHPFGASNVLILKKWTTSVFILMWQNVVSENRNERVSEREILVVIVVH